MIVYYGRRYIYIYIFIFKLEEKVNQYLHFALFYIFLKNNIFPDSVPSKSEWLNSFTSNWMKKRQGVESKNYFEYGWIQQYMRILWGFCASYGWFNQIQKLWTYIEENTSFLWLQNNLQFVLCYWFVLWVNSTYNSYKKCEWIE